MICGSNIMEVQKDFRDLLELLNAPTPSQDDPINVNTAVIFAEHLANPFKPLFN
jgi:hypothetical protein